MIGRIDESSTTTALSVLENTVQLISEAQDFFAEAASSFERGNFNPASGLNEGYASRSGILNACCRSRQEIQDAQLFAATRAMRNGAAQPDTDYDGHFVGANGATYPPTIPLNQVPTIEPQDGRTSNETLIYINGINTPKDSQFDSLQQIANRTGSPVIGIHNATQGGFLDVIQSTGDTLDIGRNPAVDTLADTIYDEVKAGRSVHLMAHSQGALITSRALQDVRNRLRIEDGLSRAETDGLLSNVKVETFGGAAGSYPDGPKYVHYVNRNDPVSTLFGLGPFSNPFVRSGKGAVVVHRFSEPDNAHGFNETYLPRRVPFEQARRRDFSH